MTIRMLAVAGALAATVSTPRPAAAAQGMLVIQRVTTGTNVVTSQMQIEPTRMRTDIAVGPAGGRQVAIFDGAKQVMYLVDEARKTYTELTKADVDRMGEMVKNAMASMPPEQRAQMEAMMRGRGIPSMAAAAKPEYRRNGTDKVGNWTCDKYDGYVNGQKTSEVCTVNPTALGAGAADFDVTRQFGEFFSGVMPDMSSSVTTLGSAGSQGFAGFPVKTVTTIAGQTVTMEVITAGRTTFPDSLFEVPAGFTKQVMPAMGGAGRGRGRGR
jgi:hypothetical protein